MRIWKGQEREGRDTGEMTLFVESEHVTTHVLEKARTLARENGISRIYLGAGKTDILSLCSWADTLRGFRVIVETTAQNLDKLVERGNFIAVILRTEVGGMESVANIFPKIETANSVAIYYNSTSNSTADVNCGLYTETDTLLYEE